MFQAHDRSSGIDNPLVRDLAKGPLRRVTEYPVYFVNGYKFHTESYGSSKATYNSGVCIRGSNYGTGSWDYYGRLTNILVVEYPALPIKRTVLFKCEWFDPTPDKGTAMHPRFRLVDINTRRRFNKYVICTLYLTLTCSAILFCELQITVVILTHFLSPSYAGMSRSS